MGKLLELIDDLREFVDKNVEVGGLFAALPQVISEASRVLGKDDGVVTLTRCCSP